MQHKFKLPGICNREWVVYSMKLPQLSTSLELKLLQACYKHFLCVRTAFLLYSENVNVDAQQIL